MLPFVPSRTPPQLQQQKVTQQVCKSTRLALLSGTESCCRGGVKQQPWASLDRFTPGPPTGEQGCLKMWGMRSLQVHVHVVSLVCRLPAAAAVSRRAATPGPVCK